MTAREMKQYKIADFEQDHPGCNFPWYKQLTAEETRFIRNRLSTRLGLSPLADNPLQLVQQLEVFASEIVGINANDEEFDLKIAFEKAAITVPPILHLNWYRFDDIDQMLFEDVRSAFWDLWYPGADDLDLFSDELDWILMVTNDGTLKKFVANRSSRFE